MQVKATKTFLHDQLGRVEKGTEFEATEAQLSGVRPFVEAYETKVVHAEPAEPAEPAKPAKPAAKKK